MTKPHKIAYLSPVWTTVQHRELAGILRYADAHPPIIVRCTAPDKNLKTAVAELESWGAEGILADLADHDVEEVLGALKHRIPIVNFSFTKDYPGVLRIGFSFKAFVESALEHLRHLGIRSSALFEAEEGPHIQRVVDSFLQIVRPPSPSHATLIFVADRKKLWDAHAPVTPVPALLADWLLSKPKPTGILCPILGSSGYLIRCCKALGLRVPEDVAVIGSDDADLSLASEPTITTILPAHEAQGYEGMKVLLEWIKGHNPTTSRIMLHQINLHVRESTGQRKPEICDIPAAMQCIKDNACRGITVEQVIKETQRVSKPTFHRRFQEVMGKSPAEAIRDRKLDEVRRLLISTELPLTLVAHLAGFGTSQVLTRAFRAVEGMSLRDYRNSKKGRSQHDAKTALRPVAQKEKGKRKSH